MANYNTPVLSGMPRAAKTPRVTNVNGVKPGTLTTHRRFAFLFGQYGSKPPTTGQIWPRGRR